MLLVVPLCVRECAALVHQRRAGARPTGRRRRPSRRSTACCRRRRRGRSASRWRSSGRAARPRRACGGPLRASSGRRRMRAAARAPTAAGRRRAWRLAEAAWNGVDCGRWWKKGSPGAAPRRGRVRRRAGCGHSCSAAAPTMAPPRGERKVSFGDATRAHACLTEARAGADSGAAAADAPPPPPVALHRPHRGPRLHLVPAVHVRGRRAAAGGC